MTIKKLLKYAIERINNKGIKNPHLEAEFLLSAASKKPREYLLAHPEKKLTATETKNYQLLVAKRCKNLPLAYLTGHQEFYGFDFAVNKGVLIPRPETELMVEKTLDLITPDTRRLTVIDLGTGSGCIIISLAKLLESRFKNRELKMIGIDISQKALVIARKNAKLNGVDKNIKFTQGNLLAPILKNNKFAISHSSLVILCNLPYLTPEQIKNSPSIKHEPSLALVAGTDGLRYYRVLLKQIKELKRRYHRPLNIFCEIDTSQYKKFISLIKSNLPDSNCLIFKDLAGKKRLIKIYCK